MPSQAPWGALFCKGGDLRLPGGCAPCREGQFSCKLTLKKSFFPICSTNETQQLSLRTCRKTCFHQVLGNFVVFHSRRNWFETSPLPKRYILKVQFPLFPPPEAFWAPLGQEQWIQIHLVNGHHMYSCIFSQPFLR